MTHAEMYEIVKGHRDVWGEHFHTVRRGDESTEFVRHFTNDAPEPEHLEAELLGLGVAWLVDNLGDTIVGKPGRGGYGVRDTWTVPHIHTWGGSLLAAVYAAIGEEKKARP